MSSDLFSSQRYGGIMKTWLTSLLLLTVTSLPAAEGQKQEPITIEADRLELDQKSGTSIYVGNVILLQGGLELQADSLTLYSDNKQLRKAIALGNPVHLSQKQAGKGEVLRAEAGYMEYLLTTRVVELKQKAHLWRNGDEFIGERVLYDMDRELVKASGEKDGPGRVRVILQPDSETTQ